MRTVLLRTARVVVVVVAVLLLPAGGAAISFITGAARGQGRAHALLLAEEGADIIALRVCKPLASARYDLACAEDRAVTAGRVEALGRRIATFEVDFRDEDALRKAFGTGVGEIGPVDIVIANAGVALFAVDEAHDAWQDTIDINLMGVFDTVETVVLLRCRSAYSTLVMSAMPCSILCPMRGGFTPRRHQPSPWLTGLLGRSRRPSQMRRCRGDRQGGVGPSGS